MKEDSLKNRYKERFENFDDSIVGFSEAQDSQIREIYKTPLEHHNVMHNLMNNVEDYSDIYFDKSCVNAEEASF